MMVQLLSVENSWFDSVVGAFSDEHGDEVFDGLADGSDRTNFLHIDSHNYACLTSILNNEGLMNVLSGEKKLRELPSGLTVFASSRDAVNSYLSSLESCKERVSAELEKASRSENKLLPTPAEAHNDLISFYSVASRQGKSVLTKTIVETD